MINNSTHPGNIMAACGWTYTCDTVLGPMLLLLLQFLRFGLQCVYLINHLVGEGMGFTAPQRR